MGRRKAPPDDSEAIQTAVERLDCFVARAPRNDGEEGLYLAPGSEITPWCTSRFQMNSTTSAPIVAMMNPAP
jgi:hypothetical protein